MEQLSVLDIASGELKPLDNEHAGRQKEPSYQQSVDLAVTAPPTGPAVEVGSSVEVKVTVVNHGPSPSPGTTFTADAPPGVRLEELTTDAGTCGGRLPAVRPRRRPARRQRGDHRPADRRDPGRPAGRLVRHRRRARPEPDGQRHRHPRTRPGRAPADPDTHSADPQPHTSHPDASPHPDAHDHRARAAPAAVPAPARPAPPGPAAARAPGRSRSRGAGPAQPRLRRRQGRRDVHRAQRPQRLRHRPAAPARAAREHPGGPAPGRLHPCGLCTLPDLGPGASTVVRVVLSPDRALRTTITATLTTTGTDANRGDNRSRIPLRILQPRIIAVPAIGKPGFVTSVRGKDFPPGAPVKLSWNPGITAAAAPTLPNPDGTFIAQLLILAKDRTGPRTITARGPGFSPVKTPFLVVLGTITPPDEVIRR